MTEENMTEEKGREIALAMSTDAKERLGVTFVVGTAKGHRIEARPDRLLEVFGTDDIEQANSLMTQCIKSLNPGEAGHAGPICDERHFMLSIVKEIAPRDAVERMLAVQMAATHVAAIRSAGLLAHSSTIQQAQAHSTGFNKLTRSFTAQSEALRKHRNGGKQTVTVHHVNVEDGGQAIVGSVQTGGEGKP